MKQSFLKTGVIETTAFVDNETGEILDENTKIHTFLANSKEAFFIGYVSLLFRLKNINWSAIQVYAYILANYPTNAKIGITSSIKNDIRKVMGSKSKNNEIINRALRELTQEKFLIKCDDGDSTFKINPRYAFKGSTMERNAALKAVIELECPDC